MLLPERFRRRLLLLLTAYISEKEKVEKMISEASKRAMS